MAPTALRAGLTKTERGKSNDRDQSVRTDSGNDISNAKPSFIAGAAGGGGFVRSLESGDSPFVPADLVSVPIGSSVMAGASQGRRV